VAESELAAINAAINSKLSPDPLPHTDTLAFLEALEIPSSPEENLFSPHLELIEQNVDESDVQSIDKVIIACTTLISDNKLMNGFRNAFPSIKIVKKFDTSVTHLITSSFSHLMAKRTLKYLLAILNGSWILSADWILESVRTQTLQTRFENYEMRGDDYYPDEEAPKRARLSRKNGETPLLSGYSIYLYGDFSTPSQADLIQLIENSGAILVKSAAELKRYRPKVVVLCDAAVQSDFEADAGILVKYRPFLGTSWLLDCISAFQITDTSPHIVI
jgi:hypothetical protein